MIKHALHPAHCRCTCCNPRHPGRASTALIVRIMGAGLIGLGVIATILFLL